MSQNKVFPFFCSFLFQDSTPLDSFTLLFSFLFKGYLKKEGEVNRMMKRRWFILNMYFLFYYKTSKDLVPTGVILVDHVLFLFLFLSLPFSFPFSLFIPSFFFSFISLLFPFSFLISGIGFGEKRKLDRSSEFGENLPFESSQERGSSCLEINVKTCNCRLK